MERRKRDEFPMKLKMLRLEQGKRQEDIAELIGISRGCLANYETGKRKPDAATLEKLADILGVSIDFLVSRSMVRTVTLNEEELRIHTRANERLKEYGDIINLNEVDVISRIELIDFFQYLKNKEERKEEV